LAWVADWAWGLPLLVVTVVAHVCFIALSASLFERFQSARVPATTKFIFFVALAAFIMAGLLGLEAEAWAGLYIGLGALPDQRSAMLYSLGAMTSYGHANLFLESRWQLLGAIEAVNGVILFGLSTACLFGFIQHSWPFRRL
jgi:hypothetical protein